MLSFVFPNFNYIFAIYILHLTWICNSITVSLRWTSCLSLSHFHSACRTLNMNAFTCANFSRFMHVSTVFLIVLPFTMKFVFFAIQNTWCEANETGHQKHFTVKRKWFVFNDVSAFYFEKIETVAEIYTNQIFMTFLTVIVVISLDKTIIRLDPKHPELKTLIKRRY